MGYKLYREVRDFAPLDWTRGERLVAMVIADIAYDPTRRTRRGIPRYVLCQRTGYGPDGLKRVLQRLAGRGYEFRISHGAGKDGREIYSAKAHVTDYQVPEMPKGGTRVPSSPGRMPVDNPGKGGTGVPPPDDKGGTGVPPPDDKGGTPVPQRRYGRTAPRTPEPLDDRSVVPGAVEVTSDSLGQKRSRGVGEALAPPRGMSKLELAAWQAATARRDRERREREAPRPDETEAPP